MNVHRLTRLLGTVLVVLFMPMGLAIEQTIILPNGETGVIDWSDGSLSAVGLAVAPSNATTEAQGRILARRGATLDAQRMLLEMVQGVRVTAETTMIQAMANDVVRSSVEGVIQGAVIIREDWDGEVYVVELEIPIRELRAVAPQTSLGPSQPAAGAPSGLVIDARGLDLTPALFVSLMNEAGDEVASGLMPIYNPSPPSGQDPAGDPVQLASGSPVVGPAPLVLSPVAAAPNRIDLIVGATDERALAPWLPATNDFLSRAIVIAN